MGCNHVCKLLIADESSVETALIVLVTHHGPHEGHHEVVLLRVQEHMLREVEDHRGDPVFLGLALAEGDHPPHDAGELDAIQLREGIAVSLDPMLDDILRLHRAGVPEVGQGEFSADQAGENFGVARFREPDPLIALILHLLDADDGVPRTPGRLDREPEITLDLTVQMLGVGRGKLDHRSTIATVDAGGKGDPILQGLFTTSEGQVAEAVEEGRIGEAVGAVTFHEVTGTHHAPPRRQGVGSDLAIQNKLEDRLHDVVLSPVRLVEEEDALFQTRLESDPFLFVNATLLEIVLRRIFHGVEDFLGRLDVRPSHLLRVRFLRVGVLHPENGEQLQSTLLNRHISDRHVCRGKEVRTFVFAASREAPEVARFDLRTAEVDDTPPTLLADLLDDRGLTESPMAPEHGSNARRTAEKNRFLDLANGRHE